MTFTLVDDFESPVSLSVAFDILPTPKGGGILGLWLVNYGETKDLAAFCQTSK